MSEKTKSKKAPEQEKLEKQCKEYLAGWQRAKADYLNLQKQSVKERESFAKYAKTNFILQVLPIYNNLQMAFDHLPESLADNDWISGILHIKDQFSNLFNELGIEKIRTKAQKFDEHVHEAVAQENKDGFSSGMIIRELSPGYLLDGEVLIPAKVIVAE